MNLLDMDAGKDSWCVTGQFLNETSGECMECPAPLVFTAEFGCIKCPESTYFEKGSCLPCQMGCKTCSVGDKCDSCKVGK